MTINGFKLTTAVALFTISIALSACQKNTETKNIPTPEKSMVTDSSADIPSSDILVGCYTTMKTEPAQIKINLENNQYTMQMRQFNDPDKPWDKPEPLQILANTELKTYFNVDEKSMEKALIRPDKVFAVAKVQDSLMNLDSRFDSNYLGYIAKSEIAKGTSTTIYKVKCEK